MEKLLINIKNDSYSWISNKDEDIGLESLTIDELLFKIRKLTDDEKDIQK